MNNTLTRNTTQGIRFRKEKEKKNLPLTTTVSPSNQDILKKLKSFYVVQNNIAQSYNNCLFPRVWSLETRLATLTHSHLLLKTCPQTSQYQGTVDKRSVRGVQRSVTEMIKGIQVLTYERRLKNRSLYNRAKDTKR